MKAFNSIEDFLDHKPFKEWVYAGASKADVFYTQFAEKFPEKLFLLEKSQEILEELEAPNKDWNQKKEDLLFKNIQGEINAKRPVIRTTKMISWPTRIVAVLTLCLGGLLTYNSGIIDLFPSEEVAVVEESWTIRNTPKGQKSKLFLPDGTTILLNADSQIKYDQDFGRTNRNIHLRGEAYFEVSKNAELPFRVNSGELVTEALGTAFNVQAYREDKIKVELTEGKVKVYRESADTENVLLVPGEKVTYNKTNGLIKGDFDLNKAILWTQGVLLFEEMPISEMVEELERWFGVSITITRAPKQDYKFSGKYRKATLKDILESMEHALEFDYKIDHKNVSISFN
ncbi:DUF4974 domain-containing protein [Echinicola sediminis]